MMGFHITLFIVFSKMKTRFFGLEHMVVVLTDLRMVDLRSLLRNKVCTTMQSFRFLKTNKNTFWLTCNRGVYRVSKTELNDYADGKIQNVHCTVFGTVDGLRSAKCNGSSQPAGIRAKDGRLWIPTMKGVAIIDPAKILQSKFPPPVFIERVLINRQEVLIDSLVQVGPGQGELEIHYTALRFTAPKQLSFKYMLVGFDKDWIEAGTRRVAYYTNIPPGNYTFKVIACDTDGIWNLTGAILGLDIAAHFYQTSWFRGLMVILLILIGFGAYRLRVWRLLAREKMLKAYVQEAMAKIKVLNGLIPICASCKKVRDDKGYWNQLEQYINEHSEATFQSWCLSRMRTKAIWRIFLKSEKTARECFISIFSVRSVEKIELQLKQLH